MAKATYVIQFILTLGEEESLRGGRQRSQHDWGTETGAESSRLQNAITKQ